MKKLALAALPLALAACQQGTDTASDPGSDPAATNADPVATSTVAAAPTATATPGGDASDDTATTIPAALQGRWGMVPADCDATRSDNKGLVTINADQIRYYESVAKPARIAERSAERIKGVFAFEGEGMKWEREMTLSLDGGKLVLDDVGEDTSPVPEVHSKCAA